MRNEKGKKITRASVGLPKGKWGGAQPTGGLRKGQLKERTKMLRRVADHALQGGIKPVEALLHNMRWYFARANNTWDDFLKELNEKGPTDEVKELMNESLMYRDRSQSCAVDAAPYFHPRLSAIAVGITSDKRFELPPDLPLNEAMSQYEENLRRFPRPDTPTTTTIEHEPSLKDKKDGK